MAKRFVLDRKHDVSGVSGTGVVAEGVVFTNGKTVIQWLGDKPSTVVWDHVSDAMQVHGHQGATEFVWID